MAKFNSLLNYLNDNNVHYQVLSHTQAFTAHQVAQASHVPDKAVAKTLLVKADHQYWMVVLGADQRLSERLLKHSLEAKQIHLAHEEELERFFPGCETSAMPPFGKFFGLPVIVEKRLTEDEEIVFNACTHTDSIRMKYEDYERLANPIVAEFAEEAQYSEGWER